MWKPRVESSTRKLQTSSDSLLRSAQLPLATALELKNGVVMFQQTAAVTDTDDCAPYAAEQGIEQSFVSVIQGRSGLVEKGVGRLGKNHSSKAQALLLTKRKLVAPVVFDIKASRLHGEIWQID